MQRSSPSFPLVLLPVLLPVLLAIPSFCPAISEEDFFQAAMIDDRIHGLPTASGTRYDRNRLSITHPYLPFGTQVQITNLATEQSALAEVIDRPQRVVHSIGLSAALAQQLGVPPMTSVEVSVTTQLDPSLAAPAPAPAPTRTIPVAFRPPSPPSQQSTPGTSSTASLSSPFRLQFGAFSDPGNAHLLQRSLHGLGIPADVATSPDGRFHRVLSLSTYASAAQAQSVAQFLKERGLIQDAIAVR